MKFKPFLIGLLVFLVVSLILVFPYIKDELKVSQQEKVEEIIEVDSVEISLPEPEKLYGFYVDSLEIKESKVKRNQNLASILKDYHVDQHALHELSIASKKVFDVRKIQPNKKITIFSLPDSLKTVKALVYEPSKEEYVVYNLKDSIFVESVKKEVQVSIKSICGVIESSLALTMDELGLTPQMTNDFADVFAWQIDFFHLYPGDKFRVIYEERSIEDEVIGIGNILAAEFEHNQNPFYAFRYDQGTGVDFFDEDGNSLRKALLRYPVKFSRISSRYSGRRFHPVQKRWKAHRGTDFAAPKGTPIRSVGDGIIMKANYQKYNGNNVKVKHNSNYETGYLHMSKIASGIRPGVKVKQGQIIGYVGSTGLAKGNHVCFRFWKNGVQVDALNVEIPPSEPIYEENLTQYNHIKDSLFVQLNKINYPIPSNLLAGTD